MPNVEKTPRQTIRIDSGLWDEFGDLVGGRNRSRVIREFIAWYVRRPKATLPKRPVVERPSMPACPIDAGPVASRGPLSRELAQSSERRSEPAASRDEHSELLFLVKATKQKIRDQERELFRLLQELGAYADASDPDLTPIPDMPEDDPAPLRLNSLGFFEGPA
ncbi:hypothetical protein ACQEU3_47090 [Spirillospora sp. CA-253888]